mgnify:CR=1 FL=1
MAEQKKIARRSFFAGLGLVAAAGGAAATPARLLPLCFRSIGRMVGEQRGRQQQSAFERFREISDRKHDDSVLGIPLGKGVTLRLSVFFHAHRMKSCHLSIWPMRGFCDGRLGSCAKIRLPRFS